MDPRIVVWVVRMRVRGKMGWILILTVQEPAAWLPKLSINKPVERTGGPPEQSVVRCCP